MYLSHYGVGHDKGGHSGRYEWGSGASPYQSLTKEQRNNLDKNLKRQNDVAKKGIREQRYRDAHTIPKGTTMYRMSDNQVEQGNGPTYVTYLDTDRNFYKAAWNRKYENTYELKEDIRVPSREELSDTIYQCIKKDPGQYDRIAKDWIRMNPMSYGYSEKVIEDVTRQFAANLKKMEDKSRLWFTGAQVFGFDAELKNAVINELKKKGYNGMTDEAGVGGQNGWSRECIDPLIIFDSSSMVQTNSMSRNVGYMKAHAEANKYMGNVRRNSNNPRYAQWGIEM